MLGRDFVITQSKNSENVGFIFTVHQGEGFQEGL